MFLSRSAERMSDPFSSVLSALSARDIRATGLDASGNWALSFDGRARLKFVAVIRGQCWLIVPGMMPLALTHGDVALVSDTRYTVASDPAVESADGMALYAPPGRDLVQLGQGDEVSIVGGGNGFAEGSASFVLDALPSLLHIGSKSPAAESVTRTLAALRDEIGNRQLGGSLIVERLAEILVVSAVRAFAATEAMNHAGWITALADRRIGKALKLMHGDLAFRWTVPQLAAEVGMSRSAFAQRFTDRVGQPPLDHLTTWRMILAQRMLGAGERVAAVAEAVGYHSQSAFAQAFKRTLGHTPRSMKSSAGLLQRHPTCGRHQFIGLRSRRSPPFRHSQAEEYRRCLINYKAIQLNNQWLFHSEAVYFQGAARTVQWPHTGIEYEAKIGLDALSYRPAGEAKIERGIAMRVVSPFADRSRVIRPRS